MLSFFRAIVIGLFQGVTELFPVSSLGHSVLIPALVGWDDLVKAQAQSESFYLAFLVALHVGYRAGAARLLPQRLDQDHRGSARAALASVASRRPTRGSACCSSSPRSRPASSAWRSSIRCGPCSPNPTAAAIFLTINGVILLLGEVLRRRGRGRRRLPRRRILGRAQDRVAQLRRGPLHRHHPGRLALRGDQPVGHHHGRRVDARSRSRGRGPLRLLDGDADHPRRRRLQDPRASWDISVTASAARRWPVRWSPRSPRTCRRSSSCGSSRRQSLTPFGIYCLASGGFCIVRFAF